MKYRFVSGNLLFRTKKIIEDRIFQGQIDHRLLLNYIRLWKFYVPDQNIKLQLKLIEKIYELTQTAMPLATKNELSSLAYYINFIALVPLPEAWKETLQG